MNIHRQLLVCSSFSVGRCLGVGLPGPMVALLNGLGTVRLFFKAAAFYIFHSSLRVFRFVRILTNTYGYLSLVTTIIATLLCAEGHFIVF